MLEKLERLGISRGDFAKETGYRYQTVRAWGDSPPSWVEKYLEMRVELLELRAFRDVVLRSKGNGEVAEEKVERVRVPFSGFSG